MCLTGNATKLSSSQTRIFFARSDVGEVDRYSHSSQEEKEVERNRLPK
jgi:hypothetical protein